MRQAISYGVDRTQVGAASASAPATNVTGLPMPAYTSSVSPQYQGMNFKQDIAKAHATMEAAGYVMGPDGLYRKNGKPVEFSVSFPAAYTDIAARCQVLVSQLKAIGMKLNINTTTVEAIDNLTATGDFDSTMGYPVGSSPRAFSFYNDTMNPNLYYPIGKATPTYQNIERYQDPQAAALFSQYPNATTDAQRQQILDQIETIFVRNAVDPDVLLGQLRQLEHREGHRLPDAAEPLLQPGAQPRRRAPAQAGLSPRGDADV